MPGILGRKIGMTRVMKDGKMTPMTIVECTPNEITQIKTIDKDGYSAIVVGFDKLKKPKKTRKFKYCKEFKIEDVDGFKKGDKITVETLQEIERINFTATSKGKGFQGVIKRHNFSRGPETHGSRHHRAPGAIGACAMPGRVARGKKMPGRMGSNKVTRKNVPVEYIDTKNNIVGVKGPIPGAKNNLVVISYE